MIQQLPTSSARRPFRSSVKTFALLAMLALVAVAAQVQASTCFFARGETEIFYSDASHTQVVGTCAIAAACGVRPGCTGQRTQFATISITQICEVCQAQ